jgi:hypothetical protein
MFGSDPNAFSIGTGVLGIKLLIEGELLLAPVKAACLTTVKVVDRMEVQLDIAQVNSP